MKLTTELNGVLQFPSKYAFFACLQMCLNSNYTGLKATDGIPTLIDEPYYASKYDQGHTIRINGETVTLIKSNTVTEEFLPFNNWLKHHLLIIITSMD
jgi:hypothetical protein